MKCAASQSSSSRSRSSSPLLPATGRRLARDGLSYRTCTVIASSNGEQRQALFPPLARRTHRRVHRSLLDFRPTHPLRLLIRLSRRLETRLRTTSESPHPFLARRNTPELPSRPCSLKSGHVLLDRLNFCRCEPRRAPRLLSTTTYPSLPHRRPTRETPACPQLQVGQVEPRSAGARAGPDGVDPGGTRWRGAS